MAVLDWISSEAGGGRRDRPNPPARTLAWPTTRSGRSSARLRAPSFSRGSRPGRPTTLTRTAFRRRLALYQRDQDLGVGYAFFVFAKADGALVGGITLRNILRGVAQTGTIGYWIGEPHARRGYTLEAVNALCRHAFGRLDLHRLEAACCPENLASRRLLLKAGFELEGRARGYLKIDGQWRDHILFGLVGSES